MTKPIRESVADDIRVERDDLGTLRTLFGTMEIKTGDYTVTADDSGKVFGTGTDDKTFTLPDTAAGLTFTFVNTGADENNIVQIDPQDDDAIFGTVANSAGDSVASGTDGEYIENTEATSNRGDYITLVGDGDDGWYIIGGVGIWASEA